LASLEGDREAGVGVRASFRVEDEQVRLLARREATLARLGGVEDCFFLQIGGDRVMGAPEGDIERTRDDGKASSVHFVRFPLKPEHLAKFRDPATAISVGCSHDRYSHQAGLSPATRAELSRDFA